MLGELVHAHVAGECDGKAGANGAAVDGGDDGHRQGAQREEALVECAHSHGVADGRVAGARLKELEVAASAEALALAGEDDGAQLGYGGERLRKNEKSIRGLGWSGRGCDGDLHSGFELCAHGDGEVVEGSGVVEGDDGDAGGGAVGEGVV